MNVPFRPSTDPCGAQVRPPLAARLTWWLHEQTLSARFSLGLALLVFVGLAALTEALSYYRSAEFASERRAATLAFASELRARADRELNSVLYLASGLVGYLVVRHQQIDADEIESIMAAVYANGRHIRNFSIAVGYRVRFVYPQAGNQAVVGRDYREIPEQWPTVKLAIDSRKLVLTGPVNLVQGGTGLIYRTPIYVRDSYWGMLASVIDLPSFQRAAFAEAADDRYEFAVRSAEGGMLWGRAELFADVTALRVEAPVPNGIWSYAVRDLRPATSLTALAIRTCGWLVAALAGLSIGLVLHQRSELARHAGIDSLTGLPNRRLFDDRLEQALRRHTRDSDSGSEVAVLFMDLDGFKPINDRYGHRVGDIVLRTVATRIRDEVRIGDTVARWAGDEFILVIENADDEQLAQLTERLRQRVAAPCLIGTTTLSVGASLGAAVYPRDAASAAELIETADRRMYLDKAAKAAADSTAP